MTDHRFPAPDEDIRGRRPRDNKSPEPNPADPSSAEPDLAEPMAAATGFRKEAVSDPTPPTPVPDRTASPVPEPSGADAPPRLIQEADGARIRDRWQAIQIDFVDDPRHAVEQAAGLVEGAAGQLAEAVAARRSELGSRWNASRSAGSAGDDRGVSTEVMRVALQEYRHLLNRLLEV